MWYESKLNDMAAGDTWRADYGTEPPASDICFTTHFHRLLELIVIIRGTYKMRTSDFEGTLHPGDIFIANILEPHRGVCPFRPNTQNMYQWLQLDLDRIPRNISSAADRMMEQLCARELRFVNRIPAEKARGSGLSDICLRLIDNCCSPAGKDPLQTLGYTFLLISALAREPFCEQTRFSAGEDQFLARVADYIEENYKEPLRLSEVAQIFGYEKSYFCRKFRAAFGESFTQHLNRVRTKKFLSHPSLNLQTIAFCAQDVGFSNYSHFYQFFLKLYERSPRAYLIARTDIEKNLAE